MSNNVLRYYILGPASFAVGFVLTLLFYSPDNPYENGPWAFAFFIGMLTFVVYMLVAAYVWPKNPGDNIHRQ